MATLSEPIRQVICCVRGVISPLLSNIVLNELDWELERRGLKFVRYADDANIYVRSERAGHRVMDSIRRFIEKRLRLKVNEEKSSVTRPHKSHFLGFRLNRRPDGGVQVQLSRRSVDRMYAKLRELTPRNWGQSLSACIRQLNRYLQGWGAYFRLCSRADWEYFRDFDAHIRRRLRVIIIQQKKRARHLYRHLVQRGVPRSTARPDGVEPSGRVVSESDEGDAPRLPERMVREAVGEPGSHAQATAGFRDEFRPTVEPVCLIE